MIKGISPFPLLRPHHHGVRVNLGLLGLNQGGSRPGRCTTARAFREPGLMRSVPTAPGGYPGSGRNSAVFLSESCPWGNDCRRPGLEDRVRSSPVNVARKELAVLVAHHEIQRLKGLADCGRPERAFRSQLIYASGDCKFMIIARFNLRHNSPPVGGIKQPGLWFPAQWI